MIYCWLSSFLKKALPGPPSPILFPCFPQLVPCPAQSALRPNILLFLKDVGWSQRRDTRGTASVRHFRPPVTQRPRGLTRAPPVPRAFIGPAHTARQSGSDEPLERETPPLTPFPSPGGDTSPEEADTRPPRGGAGRGGAASSKAAVYRRRFLWCQW